MWNREDFAALVNPPVIGMIHLQPLPGSPRWAGDFAAVAEAARTDAAALATGGIGAIMVENFHDVPFYPGRVPAVTVAAMTALVSALRADFPSLPLGVNVLRNDAESALAVAAAGGAAFVRVNVHAGAAGTDQGLIQGRAHRTLRLRRELGVAVGILADVRVKHARPLVARPIAEEATDLRQRALADGLILTGPATGAAARREDLQEVRRAAPGCPVLVGSGLAAGNLEQFVGLADGFIVGTSLKSRPNDPAAPIAREKVIDFVAALAATVAAQGKEEK